MWSLCRASASGGAGARASASGGASEIRVDKQVELLKQLAEAGPENLANDATAEKAAKELEEEHLNSLENLFHEAKIHQKNAKKPKDKSEELLEKLGGQAKVKEFKASSEDIMAKVEDMRPHGSTTQHDMIYQGTGLRKLLDDAHKMKPLFDELCQKVAVRFHSQSDLKVDFKKAPVKSFTRADVKVRVNYNGDVLQLKDAVRGTLDIVAPLGEGTLVQVYQGLLDIVTNIRTLKPDTQVHVVSFKDRYQKPAGTYRDWQFFLKLNGFLCELQVNFHQALQLKEDVDHTKYELDRMAQDNLLNAAMHGDLTAVRLMLSTKVNPQVCDLNGCYPLHYASAYGNAEMCKDLLDAGADPLALDKMGYMPLHRAMLWSHHEVAKLLVEQMEIKHSARLATGSSRINQALAAAWSIAPSTMKEDLDKLVLEVAEFSHELLLSSCVDSNCTAGVKRVLDDEKLDVDLTTRFWVTPLADFGTPLDSAISQGSVDILNLFLQGTDELFYPLHEDLQEMAMYYAKFDHSSSLHAIKLLAKHKETELDLDVLLLEATTNGAFNAVRVLLNDGARLSEPCKQLDQELLRAASKGDLRMLDLVLDAGVAIDGEPFCALTVACDQHQLKACELLLERRADVYHKDKDGDTPLSVSVRQNFPDSVRLLHSYGADLSKACYEDKTPAEYADELGVSVKEVIDELLAS